MGDLLYCPDMPISPQKQREILFQLLYSADFSAEEEVVEMIMGQLAVTKKIVRESAIEMKKILEKREELDQAITQAAQAYEFERIPRVERTILRLGLYELTYSPNVPPKVAIAEAIRLCRKFATPEAAGFVNAVMDAVLQARGTQLSV